MRFRVIPRLEQAELGSFLVKVLKLRKRLTSCPRFWKLHRDDVDRPTFELFPAEHDDSIRDFFGRHCLNGSQLWLGTAPYRLIGELDSPLSFCMALV